MYDPPNTDYQSPNAERQTPNADFFLRLAEEAQACVRCPGMADRTAVLSQLNGSLQPRVLFVAEAPGRRGGDRTRVPMSGDASGRQFHRLMAGIGLCERDVFITNAVLCNPRSETGANRPPRASEVRNCSDYLRRTIEVLDPPLIVAIGGAALKALELIEPHSLTLAEDVGRCVNWSGRRLIALYHPSPQVLISRRSAAQQAADWESVRKAFDG